MSSRAQKILGLVVANPVLDSKNIASDNNSTEKSNHELLSKNSFAVELQKDVNMEVKMVTESVDNFDKSVGVAVIKSQFANIQPLVPYDDTDDSLSDNEDVVTGCLTTEEGRRRRLVHSSSSSSSSSTSSSDSSDSSSSGSSDSSPSSKEPLTQRNPLTDITRNVTVNEQDTDGVVSYYRPRELKRFQNYYTSPLCTDESDADLSDADPTFINIEPKRKRNYFFEKLRPSSTSSADSSHSSSIPKKGRKRTKNPSQWKQNKIKRKRNTGKSYVSTSKTKKTIPARCLKEPCTEKCRLKCTTKINMECRYELFKKFWDLGDLGKQRAYISSSMIDIQPKYKYSNAQKPRHNNKAFHFIVNNKTIRVCKTFYKATLNISGRMIFTVQNKMNNNDFSQTDLRGRHDSHRKISPELRSAIMEHIQSIPKIESHYLRASTTKEYIDGSKNIKDLFNDFKLKQKHDNRDAGTYSIYYKLFTTEFNLSFFQPKNDQCDLCTSYNNSTADQKKDLEEKYQTHIKEKNCIEKFNDRSKINKNIKVVVFDLEAVLQCPRGNSSSFYYKSKLNCYNLTLTELASQEFNVAYKNVHCYFWSESEAKRGAIEIGSCVWAYLKAITEVDDDEKEVIFYSDNCCGQNKNKYITSLYLYCVQTLNIKSITHKYLIRGHTQNEADSVHSLIEKEIKKNLKSGPIYTPDQYITLIKNAKKSPPPLIVHELNFESFHDLKLLQEEWGYNYSNNTEGHTVNWNEIKVLKITKENPFSVYYKSSYKDENYREVNVRNKRKKMKQITDIELQAAYSDKQEISENKKKDLKELISKGLIPSFYAGFYNSIF
uniref:Uncharacterized protein LOC114337687 n=1 Tax=Diabrotica virgifera virgifera TaxID=50390 RepID=A0A6P7G4W5_DIAVI